MHKELIICIVVVLFVVILNNITQNYTQTSVSTINNNLEDLKNLMLIEEKEETNDKMKNILEDWDLKYQKLAYYIEHDELEKVKTELVEIKSNIEVDEYSQAIPALDRCMFILEHIKEKSALQIKNIF